MFGVHHCVFNRDECDSVIALGTAELHSGASDDVAIPEGAPQEVPDIRSSKVAWIPKRADTLWIHDRLGEVASEAISSWQFEVEGFAEDLQFTLYDTVGAHYTWHHDGLDEGLEHRKLSMVLQLSEADSYAGCDLEFLEVTEDYTASERDEYLCEVREVGTVITFPAFEYHRVTPLVSGTRYSLVAWLAGPPFR